MKGAELNSQDAAFEDINPDDPESICSRRGNFPGRDFGGVAPDLRLVLPAIQLHFGQDTGSKKRKLLRARSAARSGGYGTRECGMRVPSR